jgi:hypothetical protein
MKTTMGDRHHPEIFQFPKISLPVTPGILSKVVSLLGKDIMIG